MGLRHAAAATAAEARFAKVIKKGIVTVLIAAIHFAPGYVVGGIHEAVPVMVAVKLV